MFDNTQDDAPYLSIGCFCDTLANEMINHTREKISDALSWRTLEGVSYELYWHYILYVSCILPGKTKTANIGGMQHDKTGYDSNAFLFEGM